MYRQLSETASDAAIVFGADDPPTPMSGPDMEILSLADPGVESRVVLFLPGALELACALLRRGVSETTMVRLGVGPGRPHRVADADIAIVPQVPSAEFLRSAIRGARAMLVPLGTVTVRIDQARPDELLVLARHQLLLHGFTAVRTQAACGVVLVRAELPLCGRLACA